MEHRDEQAGSGRVMMTEKGLGAVRVTAGTMLPALGIWEDFLEEGAPS